MLTILVIIGVAIVFSISISTDRIIASVPTPESKRRWKPNITPDVYMQDDQLAAYNAREKEETEYKEKMTAYKTRRYTIIAFASCWAMAPVFYWLSFPDFMIGSALIGGVLTFIVWVNFEENPIPHKPFLPPISPKAKAAREKYKDDCIGWALAWHDAD